MSQSSEERYAAAMRELDTRYAAFHQVGRKAYRPGLETIAALDAALGNPSRAFRTVHVAGTNGKGSTASLLASVLTAAGYRTGLYTSPHLVDFRERIRIDGRKISKDFVADFVGRVGSLGLGASPSYFEVATAMAFSYFAAEKVDVAVVEVGLGGRLDSTNIITPLLSVITNISKDHTAILGDTEEAIAGEKAGIIKPGVPVVVGRAEGSVRRVFEEKAAQAGAPLIFAADNPLYTSLLGTADAVCYCGTPWGDVSSPLTGRWQHENAATVFNSLVVLSENFDIRPDAVARGFAQVGRLAGLCARWMPLRVSDRDFICDTGHNPGAWQELGPRLATLHPAGKLRMVLGFVSDKNIDAMLPYMPREAEYYFVAPESDRARSAESTAAIFAAAGLRGTACGTVRAGIDAALAASSPADTIFVGGSNFTVATLLEEYI